MMAQGLHTYFKRWATSTITVTRPSETDAFGNQTAPSQELIDAPCDLQRTGNTLRRVQQVHEEAEAIAFVQTDVNTIRPGDSAAIDADTYTVLDVRRIDNSLILGQ